MIITRTFGCMLLAGFWLACAASSRGQEPRPPLGLNASNAAPIIALDQMPHEISEEGIGSGFRAGTQDFGLCLGAGLGLASLGSQQRHDIALASLSYGWFPWGVVGRNHWFRGNFELRAEFFAGGQFSPESNWLAGLTPHLRYNFATGTRLVPFLDGGAGVSATGIGPPDLSGTFEFNLQAGAGVLWFLDERTAITIEARYMHMSCAGLNKPNLGLNNVMGLIGFSRFF